MAMTAGFPAPAVTISAYPGANIVPGQNDSLRAIAAGPGASTATYQWYVNGVTVSGATQILIPAAHLPILILYHAK